jgi:hypothetical protein
LRLYQCYSKGSLKNVTKKQTKNIDNSFEITAFDGLECNDDLDLGSATKKLTYYDYNDYNDHYNHNDHLGNENGNHAKRKRG